MPVGVQERLPGGQERCIGQRLLPGVPLSGWRNAITWGDQQGQTRQLPQAIALLGAADIPQTSHQLSDQSRRGWGFQPGEEIAQMTKIATHGRGQVEMLEEKRLRHAGERVELLEQPGTVEVRNLGK